MSKIKIAKNKYGDLHVTINIDLPVEVYMGEEDQLDQLKNMSEDELLDVIDNKIDNMERGDLGELVLNNLEVLDSYIYFFINDTDINKQIKRNIHTTLCFMNESKFINEITTKLYNYLN